MYHYILHRLLQVYYIDTSVHGSYSCARCGNLHAWGEAYNMEMLHFIISTVAVVGLEQTLYMVSEDVGLVELCVNVSFPIIECPIAFPFQVNLTTYSGTAGIMLYNAKFVTL